MLNYLDLLFWYWRHPTSDYSPWHPTDMDHILCPEILLWSTKPSTAPLGKTGRPGTRCSSCRPQEEQCSPTREKVGSTTKSRCTQFLTRETNTKKRVFQEGLEETKVKMKISCSISKEFICVSILFCSIVLLFQCLFFVNKCIVQKLVNHIHIIHWTSAIFMQNLVYTLMQLNLKLNAENHLIPQIA